MTMLFTRAGLCLAWLWMMPALSLAQVSLEPPGSQRMVDCGFSNNLCTGQVFQGTFKDWNQTIYGNPAAIVQDPSAPVSPPWVADSFLPLGSSVGGNWLAWWNSVPSRELYLRGRIKLNAEFSCSSVGVTKLTFLRNYENAFGAPITNGVFQMRGCGAAKTMEWSHNTGGLDNSHICGGDAIGNTCFPNVGTGQVTRGSYFDFQACASASTTTTSRDGVIWWAINGVMAGKYTAVNYGAGKTTEWVMNNTWDGNLNGQGFTSDTHIYWDHVYLSTPPPGGCLAMAGGGGGTSPPPPPPLPPNKPTNLRVQ